MKSSVLGIGTELTDGQIINRNASWISAKLKPLGARSSVHLVIPDDRPLILEALDICAKHSDIIFVTGGLGPTSDDFTRDLISEWSGLPLEFHEPSWQAVIERLTSRGYQVQEFQRQQCYFPKGAEILFNSLGTANGFRLKAKGRHLIVLPGPPREIEAIWTDHLQTWVSALCAGLDPFVTHSWDTIGLGESQIAAMVEPVIKGHDLEVGYRVHLPYVEFKVTHRRSEKEKHAEVLRQIDQTLLTCTVARNGEDAAKALMTALRKYARIQIIDEVTGAVLLQRVAQPFQVLLSENRWSLSSSGEAEPQALCLFLRSLDENKVRIGLTKDGQTQESTIEAPMKAATMSERRKQYFAEMALIEWRRLLS